MFSNFVGQLREGLGELREELRSQSNTALSPVQALNLNVTRQSSKPPPSVAALGESKRLVLCGFPGVASTVRIPAGRSLKAIPAAEIIEKIGEITGIEERPSVLVWNLSGKKYDYSPFNEQVVESDFPGFASPPLKDLMELATSVQTWLNCGKDNVAIIHDISGRRSAIVAACVLVLKGEAEATSDALRVVARAMGRAGRALVPSQWRYHSYYCDVFKGKSLTTVKSLRLMRVIVNGIPDFVNSSQPTAERLPVAVKPFMRLFFCHTLLGKTDAGPVYRESDGCFSLAPKSGVVLRGDVLLRVYHASEKKPLLMFSATFHTAFVGEENVLRLSAKDLDGAIRNARFPSDFHIDVIFADTDEEPANSAQNSKSMDGESLSSQQHVRKIAETSKAASAMAQSMKTPTMPPHPSKTSPDILSVGTKNTKSLDAASSSSPKENENNEAATLPAEAIDIDIDIGTPGAMSSMETPTTVRSASAPDTTLDEIDALLNGDDFSADLDVSDVNFDDDDDLDLAGFASGLGLDDILKSP